MLETLHLVLNNLTGTVPQPYIDGLVLTGGCALNVLMNSRIQQEFPSIPLHIPAAPSDCGLAVGGAWHVHPPPKVQTQDPAFWVGYEPF